MFFNRDKEIKMKKIFIASAIVMGLASTTASANGDVTFFGSVTANTCNLIPEVNGAVNRMIQLGQSAPNAQGTPVPFSLITDPADANNCNTALGGTNTATISWSSPQLGGNGLGAASGTATDARVVFQTRNAQGAQTEINTTTDSATFTGANILQNGAQFNATLHGGATAGDFRSAVAYVVTYQ